MNYTMPLLHLKETDMEGVKNFLSKAKQKIGHDWIPCTVEQEIGGVSIAVKYKRGVMVGAKIGRGNSEREISGMIKYIDGIPLKFPPHMYFATNYIKVIEVRCEVYFPKKEFAHFNEQMGKQYKNSKYAVHSILRTETPEAIRDIGLHAIAVDILNLEYYHNTIGKPFRIIDHSHALSVLRDFTFAIPKNYTAETEAAIEKSLEEFEKTRNDFPYPVNGAVVKLQRFEQRVKMGEENEYSNCAVLYKFPTESKEADCK